MPHPKVKGLPAGWAILKSHEKPGDPRSVVIMCEREGEVRTGTRFVVWNANLVEGGVFWGHYTDDETRAKQAFADKMGRM